MGCGALSRWAVDAALLAQDQQNHRLGHSLSLADAGPRDGLGPAVRKPVTPADEFEHDLPADQWTFDGTWKVQVAEGRINYVTIDGENATFTGHSFGTWSDIKVDMSQRPPTFQAQWLSLRFGSRGYLRGHFQGPKLATYNADGGTVHSAVCQKVLDLPHITAHRMATSSFDLEEQTKRSGTMPPSPVEWGMSLRQIQHFRDYLQLKGAFDADGKFRKEPPNMYELCTRFIKPMTNGTGLSLALLYNPQPRPANIFISHSWAEGFLAFVANLESGAGGSQRPLRKDDVAWICTFAVNQNANISEELGSNPEESPFAKVMREALEVVVVFNDTVDLYSRVWCCFEMFLALEWQKDVRAVGAPVGWTEVVNNVRRMHETQDKVRAIENLGQKHPVNIQAAKASMQRDKDEIMQDIQSRGAETFGRINSRITVLRQRAWEDLLLEMQQ